ncbi:MAG: 1,4-dihydroxy-6-naphthoate synthase [SAR324 cluster bacterium]|nr:1,4-dihydroxy-6-naphthoate synthase [SAR324 cluster bacterium]
MSRSISLAYSPCPNDTFIFYAMTHGHIDTSPFLFDVRHCDIHTLNDLVVNQQTDMLKVSVMKYFQIQADYHLLTSGAALGMGYGPVVLTPPGAIRKPPFQKVGLPGKHTTAHLLFSLWNSQPSEIVFLPFREILTQLKTGKLDAGVIIHESRFTYENQGIRLHVDLGAWWQEQTGMPLPLGCICLNRQRFSATEARQLSDLVRQSIDYARNHTDEVLHYILEHADEKDPQIALQHIELYVNQYTDDLGDTGLKAMSLLEKKAHESGGLTS